MLFNQYANTLNDLQKTNQHIKRQLYCLQGLQSICIEEKFPIGEERRVKFDLPELFREYSWKANKCNYFLNNYIDGLLKEIDVQQQSMESVDISDSCFIISTPFLDEAIYNFDAFVLAASALLEGASIDYMAAYLKKTHVAQYYPKKREIGLYWQLNLLRNRIVHHTGGRYVNAEVCQRYSDFTSRVNCICLKDGHVQLECTQIDVYRSVAVQKVIKEILQKGDESNVFDCLFPNKTAKGYERKNPGMLYLPETIRFDHASSGVRFVSEIQQFILNMNEAFFVEFAYKIHDKTTISEFCMINHENGIDVECRAKDLFDIGKIPKIK